MIVTTANFATVVALLETVPELGIDTETTGLRPFHGDHPFSLILATEDASFYFNFQEGHGEKSLSLKSLDKMQLLFSDPSRLWYGHNIKFDLHMLATLGIELAGHFIDTKVTARLLYNDHLDYTLAACAKREGLEKSAAVDEHIAKEGLWDWVQIPGKKSREKHLYFDRVPFDIISQYGETDGRITFDLGAKHLTQIDAALEPRPLRPLLENEIKLTKTVFHVEQRGILIDPAYCMEAIRFESSRCDVAEAAWLDAVGEPFVDSGTVFAKHLPPSGVKTKKSGKDSYDADALEGLAKTSPLAQTILDWRDAKKRLNFYNGFLYHADKNNVVHANLDQAGTKTGRFSASSPNLQQLNKEEGGEGEDLLVRRAIIPRPGYFFAMLDLKANEYRLMLDYAGLYTSDHRLIEAVKGGLDVHQATADRANVTRTQAKTVNFAILFGSGLDLLAANLGTTRDRAAAIRDSIFEAAPEIKIFLRQVARRAEERGFITNWFGRRWHCPNPEFSYKGPNFICQGGGADIIKVAMPRIEEFLESHKTRMVLQIHDEIVLEVADGEEHLVPECAKILEAVYPYRFLPQVAEIAMSRRSLADKEPWVYT